MATASRPTAPRPSAEPRHRRPATAPWLLWLADHAFAVALTVMFLAPFVFLFLTSMMTSQQALTSDFIPNSWHPDNYVKVFQTAPLGRYMANTADVRGAVHDVHAAEQRARRPTPWPGSRSGAVPSRSCSCSR